VELDVVADWVDVADDSQAATTNASVHATATRGMSAVVMGFTVFLVTTR